jgi:hypothetical protein
MSLNDDGSEEGHLQVRGRKSRLIYYQKSVLMSLNGTRKQTRPM